MRQNQIFVVELLLCLFAISVANAQTGNKENFSCVIQPIPHEVEIFAPLRLNVRVQYDGKETIKASLPQSAQDRGGISIKRLNASANTTKYFSGGQLYTDAFVDAQLPRPAPLPPGSFSVFSIILLYDWHDEQFIFGSPGDYEIQVHYWLDLEDEKNERKEKLVVGKTTVKVLDSKGKDAGLWQQIILSGSIMGSKQDGALQKVKNFVEQYPRSPYRPYALAILGNVYGSITQEEVTTTKRIAYLQEVLENYPQFAWKDEAAARLYGLLMNEGEVEQAQKFAKVILDDPQAPLRIKRQVEQFQPSVIFPQDKRLDQQVTYNYPQQTPYTEVLAELSRQTGISLSLHPDLKKRSRASLETMEPLRETMRSLGSYKALWIRDGDGYKLIPAPQTRAEK